ncbi:MULTISPECIES: dTDP-4-amino-4,6-dideoxygalactose transaminase [Agrobacterium]|uniref:dTDP-4-amino-4,6-dideoxygalactose transaminase n=1 Tax=Agrobacterium tumefaciens TaxID=358 RepID=A0AAE6BDA8_AGRTU|nr:MULTISPECIES: dTDP-4-amino-4,6-dideoxygalactose transaminase [Agrobacterium]QCL75029.1 dTDP-4-amino-4,6-dideoxygalactose transaminase [Agrobacterium tumefaciens]QCL80589.1 dTDP-4-amino-4,6-dideoxygalactose transaminase [Agrobacterium tumefaciens]
MVQQQGDIIAFNWPYMTGRELHYIAQCHANGRFAGDGAFTRLCHQWLRERTGAPGALLTHSCTAALEMAAILLNLQPGDEVIMPSFTFVSTANAFVLRGAVPVFVDIRPDTLNLDETQIEAAITSRTRAIAPVHYAGIGAEMDQINAIAAKHGLAVVEDAAQGVASFYRGQPLGSLGTYGAFSFHETKNVISGEGGALIVNDPAKVLEAEIVREKGTDRSRFLRGEVDKYTWRRVGSSFLPGELIAAFLWAQLQEADSITATRLTAWNRYFSLTETLEGAGLLRRPFVPPHCTHNAHMFYILLADGIDRGAVLSGLAAAGVNAVFHYVPLHSSPAGLGRYDGSLPVTDHLHGRLIRLPLWCGLTEAQQQRVVETLSGLLHSAMVRAAG